MSNKRTYTALLSVLCPAVLFSITWALLYRQRYSIADDAFIYLRIAQNLGSGHGWAFNPGIVSNAATSPLYAILLAFVAFLKLSPIATLITITLIGFATLATAIYFGTLDMGRSFAAFLALLAGASPTLVSTIGLESSVYLACIALTALAFIRGQYALCGFCAGLTALGRPEGIAMLPLILAVDYLRRRKISGHTILVWACTVTPWLIFSYFTFHGLLPHTMQIKHLQSSLGYWAAPFLPEFGKQLLAPHLLPPLAILGFIRILMDLRSRPFLGIVVLYCTIQVVGYAVLKAPTDYFWYFAPGNLGYVLSAAVGASWLFQWLLARFGPSHRPVYDIGILAIIAMYLVVLFVKTRSVPPLTHESANYRVVGAWMRSNSSPDDWIACDEIGYMGVYSQRNVRDMLGLLEAKALIPLKSQHWDWWFTDDPEPRFILMHTPRWAGEPGAAKFPWSEKALQEFSQNYQKVFGAGDLVVLERKQ